MEKKQKLCTHQNNNHSNPSGQCELDHRIVEYPELEGTHRDHRAPGPAQDTPDHTMV